ncbi:MAG TPA: oxygenase MpaB family protein [Ilumatobacter sp.]|nr:oxygenase MpaB family protein [Ilumatobacter sp.]
MDSVREALGAAVRNAVVGPDAGRRHAELIDGVGDRWFPERSPIHVVHADSSMFVGGLRALLFQSLHPLAMAGVAQHSDYRADPWGRLQRTADFLAATTFGPAVESERAVARVRAVHRRVTGVASDGRTYSANDPHLLAWVHLAEIDSFITAHSRYGARPLDAAGYDTYVAQTARVAEALGVVAPPMNQRELAVQLRRYRPELRGTPEARQAAQYLLFRPPMPLAVRPFYGALSAAAISMMPAWTRWPLRLPWLPLSEAVVARPLGEAMTRTIRWALRPAARPEQHSER